VASGGNPDLLMIDRPIDEKTGLLKSSVPVEEIRKIAPFMQKTSSIVGGWRVVIINDADTMTRSSQNSLLKILEEPPEKSLLILVAHRAGALLPTIYSRCVHIPFMPLPDDIIRGAIGGRCASDKIPLILSMAEGSLGAAYEYTDDQHADLIGQAISLLNNGEKLSWTKIQIFADFFGNKGNEDSQRIFRETMLWVASSLVRDKLAGFDNFRSLILSRRLKIYDDLRAHFDRCMIGNLDKRFLIMGAYTAFE
jgi:DNA polymerase III subunit delta'